MNICEQICNDPIQIGTDILNFSYVPMAATLEGGGAVASITFG